ncbi:cysteine hydrolase family protein [Duganella sp. Root336D2]|uniref:cysteine hydrolase family protein n=1 Tax=Duganella sp. Root336D2 TaxID=1736518 RepID=UPI000701A85B|nr:cysteine hydrolase family protein [Duganella sp. Root336D2]KQV59755.1 isochorismatase [Duganella sp. Root336D2]
MPRRALIVIDVQNEYFSGKLPIEYPPVEQSLPNIVQSMKVARESGIPVVVVQHDTPAGAPVFAVGSDGWQLHPQVAALGADLVINKKLASSFAGTGLAQWLADKQVDTLTIAGYMSHNCNASTIIEAAHMGLAVEYLADASGSLPYENAAGRATAEEIHRIFSVVFHSNFAAVTTTREWADAVGANQALAKDNIYLSNARARQLA